MNTPNPFKPPEAPVADVGPGASPPRGVVVALLVVGLLELGWFALWLPGLVTLVDIGGMPPIVGLLLVLGEACLAIGLWRAFPSGLRGRRSFVAAIALLALAMVRMGILHGVLPVFGPFAIAIAVSVAGLVLVRGRLAAARVLP